MENESKNSAGKQLPLIPIPAETRWREFRVRYFPVLVFAATIFAIWRLWGTIPPSTGVRGIGEGAVSLVTSPHDGFLERMQVEPHSWVEAGQPLLTVTPFNPEFQLDILQSQLQMSRLAMEPSIADRNVIDYEQLRIDSRRKKGIVYAVRRSQRQPRNVGINPLDLQLPVVLQRRFHRLAVAQERLRLGPSSHGARSQDSCRERGGAPLLP